MYLNSKRKSCIDSCFEENGVIIDSSSSEKACKKCPENYYAKSDLSTCLETCADEMMAYSTAEFRCVKCENNNLYVTSDVTKCVLSCTVDIGTWTSEVSHRCVKCSDSLPNCLSC